MTFLRMKTIVTTLLSCAVVLLVLASSVQASRIAAGLALGEITGVSLKYWQDNSSALDLAAGWTTTETQVKLDYLFHETDLVAVDQGRLFLYYGVGGFIFTDDDKVNDIVGMRIPFGLEYFVPGMPLSLYGDLAPAMELNPKSRFTSHVTIGMRMMF